MTATSIIKGKADPVNQRHKIGLYRGAGRIFLDLGCEAEWS
jgi:hypothetical protein